VAFVEDLSVFFNAQDFALTASRTPAGGGSATSGPVVLDLGDAEADGVVFEGPSLAVAASTWPTLSVGDTFGINAVGYKARAVVAQNDGAIVRVQLVKT